MNSRTSRPRSPTSAITFTCALVDRAIMPSSEDFPTPEPAKIPRRWPRPHGTSPSSARTPIATRSSILGLDSAPGGGAIVEGHAEPVHHAPEQSATDGDAERRAGGEHARAGPDAVQLAEWHQQRATLPEADHLSRNGLLVER